MDDEEQEPSKVMPANGRGKTPSSTSASKENIASNQQVFESE